MKKRILIWSASISCFSTLPLVISCKNISHNYDLGLATEPINSLNYIKFSSVGKVLPTLVESPLKSGPNEQIKRLSNLPEIPMGIFGNTPQSNSMEEYLENFSSTPEVSPRFYPLDQFGAASGTINSDKTNYQPISAIMTENNNILSMHIMLNNGDSFWSNGDKVSADDYIDAMHYILDINTGSQRQTDILQKKFRSSNNMVDVQHEYIKKFKKPYINPFAYPELVKDSLGNYYYDVFSNNYHPWNSQNPGDEIYVENIKKAAQELGIWSGRMYWNYDNATILEAIPFSPDFDFNTEVSIVMLPNPQYDVNKFTIDELKSIPQRIATKIRKYPYFDPRQKTNDKFYELLKKSKFLKSKVKNISYDQNPEQYNQEVNKLYTSSYLAEIKQVLENFDSKNYLLNRVLALNEYSLRIEYDSYQPTSVSNAYTDLTSTLIPINRKFVESIGGIADFGLDQKRFLTNGPFNIQDLVLGAQGYLLLEKNKRYYSAEKTISDKIKIYFSSDANINSTMYDDGYIAATRVPAIQQLNYWSNQKYRPNMKKSQGFGTIALAFNLDQETNKDSYIQDNDLRNAIYYAIDRNAMLNIVGWNSSYPVITWTAFGQGVSSHGKPIEHAFDHDFMYTKQIESQNSIPQAEWKSIPIQNYTYLDHLSKKFKFENVDRTDKAFHRDIAQFYLNRFKTKHPNLKNVTLKFISNSSNEQRDAAIALQDFMKQAFGSYIKIEVKGLPENVYEDWRTTGKFDIIYRNFDSFGTDSYSYVKAFFKSDGINKNNQKTTGYRNNPAGSWTYQDYFESLGYKYDNITNSIVLPNDTLVKLAKTRLNIKNDKEWNKIVELSFIKYNESTSDYTKRYLSFFTNQFSSEEKLQNWNPKKVFGVIASLEKIVRDAAPVVPLMEVDTYWEISRVGGTDSLFNYSLQYAYDIAKPPRPNLPTAIKEG